MPRRVAQVLALCVASLVLWMAVAPAVPAAVVFRRRRQVHQQRIVARYGWYTNGYHWYAWYWETIVTLRKLSFVVVAELPLRAQARLVLLMLVSMAGALLNGLVQPHARVTVLMFDTACLMGCALSGAAILLFWIYDAQDNQVAKSAVLAVLNALLLPLVGLLIVQCNSVRLHSSDRIHTLQRVWRRAAAVLCPTRGRWRESRRRLSDVAVVEDLLSPSDSDTAPPPSSGLGLSWRKSNQSSGSFRPDTPWPSDSDACAEAGSGPCSTPCLVPSTPGTRDTASHRRLRHLMY